jgi:phage shock protein C
MKKRVYRSRRDRVLGGVAGGLAAYLAIDVVWVRIIWVILALAGGPGVLAYIICWIVIPEEPGGKPVEETEPLQPADSAMDLPEGEAGEDGEATAAQEGGRRGLGLFLIVLGAFFLLRRFSGVFFLLWQRFFPDVCWRQFWHLPRSLFWPSLLVVVGIALIAGGLRGRKG